MLTNAELQAARELCERATPEPWNVERHPGCAFVWITSPNVITATVADASATKDAAFIAAARTLLPKLLDVLQALYDQVDMTDPNCPIGVALTNAYRSRKATP